MGTQIIPGTSVKVYDQIWRWKGSWWRPIYRRGQACRIVFSAAKNSVLVEFEDGFRVCTSKWAVSPRKSGEVAQVKDQPGIFD